MLTVRRLCCAIALSLLAISCAPNDGDSIGGPIFNGTTPEGETIEPPITTLPIPEVDALRVPSQYFSIQDAVNIAQPGDLILIDPGTYTEEVIVRTPDIVLRGRDRNTVFVDGLHDSGTGITIEAPGVAIENMTVRNYLLDAIRVEGGSSGAAIDGFRVLHVTTSNTGRNGIALASARNVEITQVWASGHARAGISIESCSPCDTIVETTLAEFSARGISVTGGNGGVTILSTTSRNNRVGIVLEDGALPTTGAIVSGSVLLNNGFSQTPIIDPDFDWAYGVGIHISGTTGTRVEANAISGNTRTGLLIGSAVSTPDVPAVDVFVDGNQIDEHPEGPSIQVDAGTGVQWTYTPGSSIEYQNGPVPPGIEGMIDADSLEAIPAGPIIQPDLTTVSVPEI